MLSRDCQNGTLVNVTQSDDELVFTAGGYGDIVTVLSQPSQFKRSGSGSNQTASSVAQSQLLWCETVKAAPLPLFGPADECDATDVVMEAASLEPLIDRWLQLVRDGRERVPNQMDLVLQDLGP